jgi:hypothetical protein
VVKSISLILEGFVDIDIGIFVVDRSYTCIQLVGGIIGFKHCFTPGAPVV